MLGGVYTSIALRCSIPPLEDSPEKSTVYIVVISDRRKGVQRLLENLDFDLKDEPIAIKANFNSADSYPCSTHIETLKAIIEGLQQAGAKDIKLAERSGMENTRQVLESCGF